MSMKTFTFIPYVQANMYELTCIQLTYLHGLRLQPATKKLKTKKIRIRLTCILTMQIFFLKT